MAITQSKSARRAEQVANEYEWLSGDAAHAGGERTDEEIIDNASDIIDQVIECEHADDPVNAYSKLLKKRTTLGNSKIAKHVRIFNICSATDCPHLGEDECQVPKDSCYAYKNESDYPHALPARRQQEYLWDHLDAQTFVDAFLAMTDRAKTPVSALRINESGDLRDQQDLLKCDRIAELLAEHDIDVYLYTASSNLDYSVCGDALTINLSNQLFSDDVKDKYSYYTALPSGVETEDVEWLDDDAVQCPYDKYDGAIDCGDCRLCLDNNDTDVYIRLH